MKRTYCITPQHALSLVHMSWASGVAHYCKSTLTEEHNFHFVCIFAYRQKLDSQSSQRSINLIRLIMNKLCSDFLRWSRLLKSYCCFLDPAVRQRLAFEAFYKADCSVLSDPVAKEILMTTARGYGALIQNICGAGKKWSFGCIAETFSNIMFAKIK